MSMTNEELALEVQAGRAGYGGLWEQVRRFIGQQAFRWFTLYGDMCRRAGVELDDLMQCGFLALQDAVKAFDPARGYSLLAYLTRRSPTVFARPAGYGQASATRSTTATASIAPSAKRAARPWGISCRPAAPPMRWRA